MRKIIYLIDQPLDERNYDRFGIQIWLDRNWTVEVWDLTPLAHPRVWKSFCESKRTLSTFSGYFPIASRGDLRCRYARLGKIGYFVDFTGDYWCSLRVKAALVRRGARRVTSAPGINPLPVDHRRRGLLSKLRTLAAKGPLSATRLLWHAIVCRLAARFTRPGLVIVAGETTIPATAGSHATLRVHSFDYDIYLRHVNSTEVSPPPYAVFVDQDYCFHPDFLYQDGSLLVTAERYFPAVCAGLRAISKSLGLTIRIAAHPRATYKYLKRDYFEGFPVEYGRTAELIKNSAVVVCHDSTAIHFAVLFGKPMIFVTTDELIPAFEGRSIAQAAAELGKTPINLDADLRAVDWRAQTSVEPERYAEFKRKYIKMAGTPECPLWDVVIDYMEAATSSATSRNQAPYQSACDGR